MNGETDDRPPKASRSTRGARDAKRQSARQSFIERVARDGFRSTRIEDVCRDVGVSHREFYRWFGNKDQCYLSIFDAFGRAVVDVGQRSFDETTGPWEAKLRAGLLVAVRELVADPHRVPFLLECQAVEGGERAMWQLVGNAERVYLTDEVRHRSPPAPAAAYESIAAGVVVEPIRRYLEEGKVDRLADLVPWIVYYMTLYLFGPERAAGQRPAPGPDDQGPG
jgi:AcrR family transcriptional regulator